MSVIFRAFSTPTISNFGNVALLRSQFISVDVAATRWPTPKQALGVSTAHLKAPVAGLYSVGVVIPPSSIIQSGGHIIVKRDGIEIKRLSGIGLSPTNALNVDVFCKNDDEISVWGYNTSGGPVQWDNLEIVVAKIG